MFRCFGALWWPRTSCPGRQCYSRHFCVISKSSFRSSKCILGSGGHHYFKQEFIPSCLDSVSLMTNILGFFSWSALQSFASCSHTSSTSATLIQIGSVRSLLVLHSSWLELLFHLTAVSQITRHVTLEDVCSACFHTVVKFSGLSSCSVTSCII